MKRTVLFFVLFVCLVLSVFGQSGKKTSKLDSRTIDDIVKKLNSGELLKEIKSEKPLDELGLQLELIRYNLYYYSTDYTIFKEGLKMAMDNINDKGLVTAIRKIPVSDLKKFVNVAITIGTELKKESCYSDAINAAKLVSKVYPDYPNYSADIERDIQNIKKQQEYKEQQRKEQERQREEQEQQLIEQQEKERQLELERKREESIRFIIINSEIAGMTLLNGENSLDVMENNPLKITVKSAGERNSVNSYRIAVLDNEGRIFPADEYVTFEKGKGGTKTINIVKKNKLISADDLYFIQNQKGGITIRRYKGTALKIEIPQTISGIRVTEIADDAFALTSYWGGVGTYWNTFDGVVGDRGAMFGGLGINNTDPMLVSLVSVVIPNTVTSIGKGAFRYNAALNSVVLPNAITNIGAGAFEGCKSLKSITIPRSITEISNYEYERYGGVFENCGLTTISLHNNLVNIGERAFAGNQLQEVVLPSSIKRVGINAFIRNKINKLVISNGVIYLAPGSFAYNPLTSVTIPPSLAVFHYSGNGPTEDKGFKGAFNEYVSHSVYYTNSSLTSITLPANVDENNLVIKDSYGRIMAYCVVSGESFFNFWKSQNGKAGTYSTDGRIWTVK